MTDTELSALSDAELRVMFTATLDRLAGGPDHSLADFARQLRSLPSGVTVGADGLPVLEPDALRRKGVL